MKYEIARQFIAEENEPIPAPNKKAASAYCNSIRNPVKRAYAQLYWEFLLGSTHKPSETGLSCMAAQAVRLRLSEYTK